MIQYGIWVLGLLGCYMILRRMFQIEVTQQKILDSHKGLAEWLEKVRKDNADLLTVLETISSVQSSIVSMFESAKEPPKRVVKGIVKKSGNVYRRTAEDKKRAAEIQRQRWAIKKAHGFWTIPEPDQIKEGRIPSTAPLIQKEVEG